MSGSTISPTSRISCSAGGTCRSARADVSKEFGFAGRRDQPFGRRLPDEQLEASCVIGTPEGREGDLRREGRIRQIPPYPSSAAAEPAGDARAGKILARQALVCRTGSSTGSPGPLTTKGRLTMTALTQPQQAALQVLLRGGTTQDARAQANVDLEALHAWLNDPHFQAALHQARAHLWQETLGLLQQAAARAVETLLDAMQNCNDARVRIRAAQIIIQLAQKAHQDEARRQERRREREENQRETATKPDTTRHAVAVAPADSAPDATNCDKTRHAGLPSLTEAVAAGPGAGMSAATPCSLGAPEGPDETEPYMTG